MGLKAKFFWNDVQKREAEGLTNLPDQLYTPQMFESHHKRVKSYQKKHITLIQDKGSKKGIKLYLLRGLEQTVPTVNIWHLIISK